MIVAPNSPSPRASESASPAASPPRASGQHDAEERAHRPGAERSRRGDEVVVDRLERGDRLPHVQRARDERDREHDRRLVERDVDAERAERPAEHADAPERDEQPDPRDRRRQHERQLDERDRERATEEAAARQQVGGRRSDKHDRDLRDGARLQADDERVGDDGVRELVDQLAGGCRVKSATIGSSRNPKAQRGGDEEYESEERRGACCASTS